MDDIELIHILQNQKKPFNEAVAQKIAYLRSDDVLLSDGDNYVSDLKRLFPSTSTTDIFKDAFGASNTHELKVEQNHFSSNIQPPNNPQPKMTLSERIAALRGAIQVSPEYLRRQR